MDRVATFLNLTAGLLVLCILGTALECEWKNPTQRVWDLDGRCAHVQADLKRLLSGRLLYVDWACVGAAVAIVASILITIWLEYATERRDFLSRTGLSAEDPQIRAAYAKLTARGRTQVKSAAHLAELLARREQLEEEQRRREKATLERAEELKLFWAEEVSM
jgi:hypothetical protein